MIAARDGDSERRASVALLAAGAAAAVTTANAWRPFVRVGYPVIGGYLGGVVHTELPLYTAGAVAAPALAAAALRGWRRPAGKVGLALTAGSLAALVALDRSAKADVEVLRAALDQALGTDLPAATPSVPPRHVEPGARGPWPRTGRRSPFLAVRDIAYGPHGGRNLLDIWHHPDLPPDARAPVVMQIHGGAWVTGNKVIQGVPLLTHLASRGWVAVAINYRLAPRATWPEPLIDVKRAIAWVREHIAGHGGDPDFVAVTGGSAGAHYSALLALTGNDPRFQPGFEDVDTRVQAAVPLYGAYDLTDLEGTGRRDAVRFWERLIMKSPHTGDHGPWLTASPVLAVHDDVPPMLIIHGREDALIRVEGARLFVRRLREAGAPLVAYAELPHARHAFDAFFTVRTAAMVEAVERFLNTVRARGPHPSARRDQAVGLTAAPAAPAQPASG